MPERNRKRVSHTICLPCFVVATVTLELPHRFFLGGGSPLGFISFFILFYLFCVFPLYPGLFFCIKTKTELIFNCPIFRGVIYQVLLSSEKFLLLFLFIFCAFAFVKVAWNRDTFLMCVCMCVYIYIYIYIYIYVSTVPRLFFPCRLN